MMLTMSPETKKRTPTGIKTRAAGIVMSETEKEQHKATEEYELIVAETSLLFRCNSVFQALF